MLVGIEIGGTKLQLGLGDDGGRLKSVERRAVDPEAGAAGIRDQIESAFAAILDREGLSRTDVRAVGIGFGGPVDTDLGVVTESHQIRGWTGFPLAEWVRDRLGVTAVAIGNDADTAALGESMFGAGVGRRSPVLYVTIGSGIGGGLIVDGAIYRGSGRGAVEIGHLWIRLPGEEPQKLEQIASGWGIGRYASERLQRDPTIETSLRPTAGVVLGAEVGRAATEGDRFSLQVLERARSAMIQGLGHAVTLLAPRRIILGGGVSLLPASLWVGPIRDGLEEWVFPQFRGSYLVVPAALGEEVVLHGALALARGAVAQ